MKIIFTPQRKRPSKLNTWELAMAKRAFTAFPTDYSEDGY